MSSTIARGWLVTLINMLHNIWNAQTEGTPHMSYFLQKSQDIPFWDGTNQSKQSFCTLAYHARHCRITNLKYACSNFLKVIILESTKSVYLTVRYTDTIDLV